MQIQPKISIIVPVYKVEPYLGTCLESVLSQTYQNLEIILVDDGSPDQCGTICDQYALKDNRIRVIHQENQGLSGARNSGIDLVTGEYITFIDSDDFIDICMIELMVEQLDDMTDIVACGTVYCDESGQKSKWFSFLKIKITRLQHGESCTPENYLRVFVIRLENIMKMFLQHINWLHYQEERFC